MEIMETLLALYISLYYLYQINRTYIKTINYKQVCQLI